MYASTSDNDEAYAIMTVNGTVTYVLLTFDIATSFSTGTDIPGVAGIPVTVFVGTLVGVVALLVLLTAVIVISLCMFMNKREVLLNRQQVGEDRGCDHVSETVIELNGAGKPIELTANEAYGTHIQDAIMDNVLELQTTETQYEEIH